MNRQHKFLHASAAAEIANVMPQTIANWAEKYPALGVKVMGRWRINETVLQDILAGNVPKSKHEA